MNRIDLRALTLVETYWQKPSTRNPSCTMPRQPTIDVPFEKRESKKEHEHTQTKINRNRKKKNLNKNKNK